MLLCLNNCLNPRSYVVLVDTNLPLRARLLCASVIRVLLTEPRLAFLRGSLDRYPVEHVPLLLPLLLAHGDADSFENNLSIFEQWLASPPAGSRFLILPAISRIGM